MTLLPEIARPVWYYQLVEARQDHAARRRVTRGLNGGGRVKDAQVFLRPREVAALLGVTREHVYRLIQAREVPATRIGGAIRIPRGAWEQWLAAKAEEALRSTADAHR